MSNSASNHFILSQSVLKTLVYADIFDYPLTFSEIKKYLIVPKKVSFQNHLTPSFLKSLPFVEEKNGFYCLTGKTKNISLRLKRKKYSSLKQSIANTIAQKLKNLPFIKLIGLTGTVAVQNSDEDDDLDFIIITAPHTLWLVRPLIYLSLLLNKIKIRKPREKKAPNQVCLNLFLEDNHLAVSPQNLFLAHEICQVKPLINKDQTYEKFLQANCWVKNFLPFATQFPLIQKQPSRSFNPFNFLLFLCNQLAFFLQFFYMKPKITREKISAHQAFFHPVDLSPKILSLYQQKLSFYLKKYFPKEEKVNHKVVKISNVLTE